MSTITPTGGQTALAAPPVATPTVVIEAGEATQAAVAGNIITGTVIGRDPRGAVQLRTQNGVILLQTNARLPVGATVTLEVQAVGPQLQAVLLQVVAPNGRPLTIGIDPAFPQAPTSAGPTLAAPPTAGVQPASVTVGEGPTVTAIVVGPAGGGVPPAGTVQAPAPDAVAPAPGPGASSPLAPGAQASGPAQQATTSPAPAPQPGADHAAAMLPGLAGPGRSASASAPSAAAPVAIAPGTAAAVPPVPGAPHAAGPAQPAATPTPVIAGAQTAATLPAAAAAPLASAPGPSALPGSGLTTQQVPAAAPTTPTAPGNTPATATTVILPQAAPAAQAGAAASARTPIAVPVASSAVIAAVIQSEAAAPAATLAYAATQSATTHVPPPPRAAALAVQALVETPPGAVAARSGASAAPLPPGSTLEVRVAVTAGMAAQPPVPGRTQLLATIVGRTPTGQAIVDTAAGRLAVPLTSAFAAAPVGTRLTLDVVAWRAAPAPRTPATHLALETAAVRPVADTVDAIARASRGRVDPHDVLPRPGPRLAQQLADTAAAISTGKVSEWLGKPAVEALERRGQGELVRRLEHDLYEAARAAPQTTDWRSMILPFMVGDALRPLRLYVRQRHERARDKQQGTRFVLECDHDELGALQLDGLVHAKRIDLILRTRAAMPERMRGDLTALFGDACGVMGYSGQIEFQAVPAFPAMPRAEPTTHHVGVVA